MYGYLICLSLIFTENVIFGLPTSLIPLAQTETGSLLQNKLLHKLHIPNDVLPGSLNKRIVDKKDIAIDETKFCTFCQQPAYEKSRDCSNYCMPSTQAKSKVTQQKQIEKGNPIGGGEQKVILGDTLCAFCKQFPEYQSTSQCLKSLCSMASVSSPTLQVQSLKTPILVAN
ncbi:uncharacterized protein LOC134270320 [Saccostrea cucullata]|uniref:uncharacterized protein LOC134270320 n=1 Tax=Saccostrea cuccullata TaxID=36930 RepID=UPI002ED480B5